MTEIVLYANRDYFAHSFSTYINCESINFSDHYRGELTVEFIYRSEVINDRIRISNEHLKHINHKHPFFHSAPEIITHDH